MTIDDRASQDIYKPLVASSVHFLSALRRDVKNHFGDADEFAMGQLLQNQCTLETVGVIFALLGVEMTDTQKWTVLQLMSYVQCSIDRTLLPIFFLDEVLPHHHGSNIPLTISSNLRLARNLLRAVGLVPVLMGTNSCAANFISASRSSRGEESLWCKLITRLPHSNSKSLETIGAKRVIDQLSQHHPSLVSFLNQQFQSCTPWFIALFVTVVEENELLDRHQSSSVDFLDEVLCGMSEYVYTRKGAILSQEFLRAQFCYHLEHFRRGEQKKCLKEPESLTPTFVSSHFASLDDENCDLFITSENNLIKNKTRLGERWIPTASFLLAPTSTDLNHLVQPHENDLTPDLFEPEP
jgi:hypothetical protein